MRASSQRSVEPLHTLSSHALGITGLSCSQGSHTKLASTSQDGSCVVWDLASGTEICCLKFYTSVVSAVFAPHEHVLYVASANGRIYEAMIYPFNSSMLQQHQLEQQQAYNIQDSDDEESNAANDDGNELQQQQYFAEATIGRSMSQVKMIQIEDVQNASGKKQKKQKLKLSKQHYPCHVYKGHTYVFLHKKIFWLFFF